MDDLLGHVLFLTRHLKKNDARCASVAILMDLGIPEWHGGFDDLVRAVILRSQNPEWSFTKELYPEVGWLRRQKIGWNAVERSIRYSISTAWKGRNKRIWCIYFPPDEAGKAKRPTNAEFISRIARVLELWQNCREEEKRDESEKTRKFADPRVGQVASS